ncbi:MAG: DUF4301 family protein [Bacteroidales bacterium]|nr:DUF4301 family protein [Bacteroidales bacterium]MCF8456012.1 DUF4301 family protein [Bacteroidales bacterium]
MFSKKDVTQIVQHGVSVEQVAAQIEAFKTGFPFMEITRAATLGNGLFPLDETKVEEYATKYENQAKTLKVMKFVPASGAATRMFKQLFDFMNNYTGSEEEFLNILVDRGPESLYYFFENLNQFAFYNDLKAIMYEHELELDSMLEKQQYIDILDFLLTEKGLNYGNLPKGLILFHKYIDFSRTAVEEHMVEGANYCRSANEKVPIHFTVSEQHHQLFIEHINSILPIHEERHGVTYDINFSFQDPSTDTIAVDLENEPFRDENGDLLFRPGGHGALIENLNNIEADLIFVKNIDNIVPDRMKKFTAPYKKTIAGILLSVQETIFKYLNLLDKTDDIDDKKLDSMLRFLEKDLCIVFDEKIKTQPPKKKAQFIKKKLNRPIRVCGMVPNEGEPGGGPFFAVNPDGTQSLHIIESSQFDSNNDAQKEIIQKSTHFNPVDLVCGTKNYKGKKFDLHKFTDQNTGFISQKSQNGRALKALELPGLWNGAMSDWNTIFVQVPIETFNPVKTINDLLREEHRTFEP